MESLIYLLSYNMVIYLHNIMVLLKKYKICNSDTTFNIIILQLFIVIIQVPMVCKPH